MVVGDDEAGPLDHDDLPALHPISAPRKLAEDASDLLREQILSGNLRPGTHLVEAKLAARLAVSRGTVREALKILIADGLVREESRQGAFVLSLSPNDVREIYDVRAAVEGRAARLLAMRSEPELLAPLAQTLEAIALAEGSRDRRSLRSEDLAFHAQICELTGNARLLEIFNRYVPVIQMLLTYDQLVPYAEASAEEHRRILKAITSGDADGAQRAVVEHCERARDKVTSYLEGVASI